MVVLYASISVLNLMRAATGSQCSESSQVKSSHLYLYSAFNNTNCDKATAQYQNGKIVSIM